MQWSSEGLESERELEGGKECFLGGERGGMETSTQPGVFPPCFYHTPPSSASPTHSPSSLNLWDDWDDWCATTWRETREEAVAGTVL